MELGEFLQPQNENEPNKFFSHEIALELISITAAATISRLRDNGAWTNTFMENLRDETRFTSLSTLPLRFNWDSKNQKYKEFALPYRFIGNTFCPNDQNKNEFARAAQAVHRLVRPNAVGPTYQDFIAFPPKHISNQIYQSLLADNQGELIISVHSPIEALDIKCNGNNIPSLEIHPELDQSAQYWIDWSVSNKIGLTLDTYHLRRKHTQTGDSPLLLWEYYINKLVRQTNLIHFQPHRGKTEELSETLNHKPTELGDMITNIKELGYKGPVVVEYLFPILQYQIKNRNSILPLAKDIADYLKEELYGQSSTN